MSKPRMKLRLVQQRPLAPLTLAEKRAAVLRDFKADPWVRGEGPRFFTEERVLALKQENESRRKRRGK